METKNLLKAIAAVSILTAMFSCAKQIETEITPVEIPEETTQAKTYTLTVNAKKGEPGTRALNLDEETHTLTATWKAGDEVKVYDKDRVMLGVLTAQRDGASTTLSGTLEGTIAKDDILQLSFLSPEYGTQGGTLAYIADKCDYATAEVKVTEIDDDTHTITIEDAVFVTQQAIVRFTLKTYNGEASQYLNNLTIVYKSDEPSGTIEITGCQSAVNTNGNGIVYVAFPAVLDATVNLSAGVVSQNDSYFYEKTGITFGRGRYYEIGVKMSHVLFIRTEEQLRTNMNTGSYNNYTLLLKNDIQITGEEIPANYNQTINLNCYTISRSNRGRIFNVSEGTKLTITGGGTISGGSATDGGAISNSGELIINDVTISGNTASGHGGAIYNGGTRTVNGGTISGNTGNDAGAIYNAQGKTLTINGGTFSNNKATTYSGGAVVNEGTAYVNGGTFTGNEAQVNGGAIYNYGTLYMAGGEVSGNTAPVGENGNGGGIYIHGNGGDLYMSGNPRIYGNSSNNLYLGQGKVVNVNGKFDTGANIGVTRRDGLGVFTTGYNTNNSGTFPQTIFHSDNDGYTVKINNNEGALETYDPTELTGPVTYLDMWETNRGEKTIAAGNYTKMSDVLASGDYTLGGDDTWYVVDKNLTFNSRINIQWGSEVNLLLMDNTGLTANKGIYIPNSTILHIYAQSNKWDNPNDLMGRIDATANEKGYSGVGGKEGDAGNLHIHGGIINAIGGQTAAGIHASPTLGESYSLCIYGGFVVGGGGDYGAGIGGNFEHMCPSIKITGGIVFGVAGTRAAGIGSGYAGKNHDMLGGYSYQPGHEGNIILITGGDVTGYGSSGAGIGGGQGVDKYDGDPADVYVRGGTVHASTLSGFPPDSNGSTMWGAIAIGWGENGMEASNYLQIYDGARVSATDDIHGTKTLKTYAESRNNKYKKFKSITIEPCTEHVYENGKCKYCNLSQPQP